jgi:uncharacterized membrane protein
MSREAWLSLHILGVVLFLGNIIVTAVWKVLADRTKSPPVVAYAQRLVTRTDIAFTATGVVLILVSGQVLAEDLGGVFGGPVWLTIGWSLFVASGVIWVAALIPERYWLLSTLWSVFGAVATILPLANLYFMVFKPG